MKKIILILAALSVMSVAYANENLNFETEGYNPDRNGDGNISRKERIFDKVDRNDNGKISRGEKIRARKHTRQKIRRKTADRNNDGRLSKGERKRYIKRKADLNNDGKLGKRERRMLHNKMDRNDDGRVSKREVKKFNRRTFGRHKRN